MSFYGRKYRIVVTTFRGEAIEVSNLRCTFVVSKNIMNLYQFAEATIYNLSPFTETDIIQNGRFLTIEAGYEEGPYGQIFQGYIRQPIRGKEDGTTYFLKLLAVDGDEQLNLGFCNFVLGAGQNAQTIAKQVARSSTVPFDVRVDADLSQAKTQRGKVFFGMARDYIRSMAINSNSTFFFNQNKAYVSGISKGPPSSVVQLNAKTGMIGIPHQTDGGVKVRSLINPALDIDSWIKLNNREIVQNQLELGQLQTLLDLDGLYRVVGLVATGDTRGQDWYFDLETVSQAGYLPAMLAGGGQTAL